QKGTATRKRLAIAATIALTIAAVGTWIGLRHRPPVVTSQGTYVLTPEELVPLKSSNRPYITNSLGMKFTRIEPAEFIMGTAEGEFLRYDPMEMNQHKVKISHPYLIQVTHVTRGQFAAFVQATQYVTDAENTGGIIYYDNNSGSDTHISGRSWSNLGFPQADDHPVIGVSWNDAIAFAAWISQKEGKNYSLPTEAEWEYAARGGTTTPYFWGDLPDGGRGFGNTGQDTGWNDGFEYTSPVGFFKPNPFGLYDVVGNAWEWCYDFQKPLPYPDAVDPAGPVASADDMHMTRGAAFHADYQNLRIGARFGHPGDYAGENFGFRLVIDNRPWVHPVVDARTRTPSSKTGESAVIDLMKTVDLARDNRRPGGWVLQDGHLTSAAPSGNELEFSNVMPAEYDLHVVLVPPKGVSHLMFFVPAGTRQINWDVGARDNTACGIDLVDGKDTAQNVTTQWAKKWLIEDVKNTVTIKVRKHHFQGYVNDKLVCDYETDYHEIGLAPWVQFKRPDTVGVMFNVPGVVLEAAEVTEIRGIK
ncbi:MAG TPA: SUMF1/EgtB/PvdO family nonheme iron enzyme, partial [Phycisphaerae bacterium]